MAIDIPRATEQRDPSALRCDNSTRFTVKLPQIYGARAGLKILLRATNIAEDAIQARATQVPSDMEQSGEPCVNALLHVRKCSFAIRRGVIMSNFVPWQRAYRTTGLLGAGGVFAVLLAGSASAAPLFVTSPAASPDQNVKAVHLVCDHHGRCYRSGRYVRRYSSYGYNPYYAYGYGPGFYGYGPTIAFGFGGGHHFGHGFGGHGFGGHGFGGHGFGGHGFGGHGFGGHGGGHHR